MDKVFAEYQAVLADCKASVEAIDLPKEMGYQVSFAIFSANLTNFLPAVARSEHAGLYRELLLHKTYENFDQQVLSILDFTDLEGNVDLFNDPSQNFIVSAFHLGSYRSIGNLLLRKGYEFSLMVRKEIYAEQMDQFLDIKQKMQNQFGTSNNSHVLNAEDPSVLVKILRELRDGRSLLTYLDGNTGTDTKDKLVEIGFLNQRILARKGLAYLSYMAKVPIVPVICYRRANGRNVMHIGTPVSPDATSDREQYAQETTQTMFNFLGSFLNKYPSQWEGWHYVHKFLKPTTPTFPTVRTTKKLSYHFNTTRYVIFDLQTSPLLFDNASYQTYEITPDLKELLLDSNSQNQRKILGSPLFNDLIQRQILI